MTMTAATFAYYYYFYFNKKVRVGCAANYS